MPSKKHFFSFLKKTKTTLPKKKKAFVSSVSPEKILPAENAKSTLRRDVFERRIVFSDGQKATQKLSLAENLKKSSEITVFTKGSEIPIAEMVFSRDPKAKKYLDLGEDSFFIHHIFVENSNRRRKLLQQMFSEAVYRAKKHWGAKRVYLITKNRTSNEVYKRLGFDFARYPSRSGKIGKIRRDPAADKPIMVKEI